MRLELAAAAQEWGDTPRNWGRWRWSRLRRGGGAASELDLLVLPALDPLAGDLGLGEAEGGRQSPARAVPVLRRVALDLEQAHAVVLRALREPRLDGGVPQLLLL